MNWDAIGALGEIVGATAVVLTLIYLARQIKLQNRAGEIAAFEGILDELDRVNSLIAEDKNLYRLFMTGLNNPAELDDDEGGSPQFCITR